MNSADKQRKALGKGLSALLPARGTQPPEPPAQPPQPQTEARTALPSTLPLDQIHRNRTQPRTVFDEQRLLELAASIESNGIIQPLIVRKIDDGYQIVAGERRWRAARIAGLTEVPVVIQEIAEPRLLEVALIENIQREDLNPIELALAYDRLGRELGLSQEEIGSRTGKDRTSIANTIRLLKLPKEVQNLVAENRLSPGHARALLALPSPEDQIKLAEKASNDGMSVRQIETAVKELTSTEKPQRDGRSHKRETSQDPNVRAAVETLESVLGTRVRIIELSEQRGRIEIEYYSQAELDRLYNHLAGEE